MSKAPSSQPHHTVADYSQWDGRWEIWNGIAVATSPSPFGAHAKLLARLVAAMCDAVEAAACDATVLVAMDWIVSQDTVVRPDITVVCGPEPAGHVVATPALVAEVLSETTRERDMVFKRALYESRKVSRYLIADPDQRVLHILSLGLAGRYDVSMCDPSSAAVTFALCDGCCLAVDPTNLFR